MKKTMDTTSVESGVSGSKKMTTEDLRKKKNELEKKRKLENVSFEVDKNVNPHISFTPRYTAPPKKLALKHQRPQEECQKELTDSRKWQGSWVCKHPPSGILVNHREFKGLIGPMLPTTLPPHPPSGTLVNHSGFKGFIGPMLPTTLPPMHLDKLNDEKKKPKKRKKSTDSLSDDEAREKEKKLKKMHLKKLKKDAKKKKKEQKKERKEKREHEKKLKKAIKQNEKFWRKQMKKAKKAEEVRKIKMEELKRLIRLKRANERMHLWQDPALKETEGSKMKLPRLDNAMILAPRQ